MKAMAAAFVDCTASLLSPAGASDVGSKFSSPTARFVSVCQALAPGLWDVVAPVRAAAVEALDALLTLNEADPPTSEDEDMSPKERKALLSETLAFLLEPVLHLVSASPSAKPLMADGMTITLAAIWLTPWERA